MASVTRAYDPVKQLWYQDVPGKGRVWDSPAAYGQAPPVGGGGALHKNTTWDQSAGAWDQGIDWGKVYAWGMGAALGAGALSAGGAFGGAAGSGSGASGLSATSTGLPVTPGLGTAGGHMGWLDIAKEIYGGYTKAKGIYDTTRSAYGDLAGGIGAAAGGASAG